MGKLAMTSDLFGEVSTDDVCTLDKLHEVERELGYRRRVYARLVMDGKMTQDMMNKRILIMTAIYNDISRVLESESQKIASDLNLPYRPDNDQAAHS